MKTLLAIATVLWISAFSHAGFFDQNQFDPALIISELEEGKIKKGTLITETPLAKPTKLHWFKTENKEWMLGIYEYKKRRLHLYSKDHRIFMARLFDERKGGQETDTIYFCNFEVWKEFVKIKQSQQDGGHNSGSSAASIVTP